MSEMIERVVSAIEQAAKDCEKGSNLWKSCSIAAMAAMREPTEEMLDAGAYDLDMTLRHQWQNMIDAALKE